MPQSFQNLFRSLLVVSLFLSCGTAPAAEQVQTLMTQLGFDVLLADIPDVLANSIEQKQKETGEFTPQRARELNELYRRHYRPEQLLADIARAVEGRVSATHLQQVANLLTSKQGQKLLALQQAATSDKAFEEIRALSRRHKEEALTPERQKLLESYDNACARTEFFVAAQALAIYGIMHGFHELGLQAQDTSNVEAMLNLIYQQLHRPSRYTVFLTLRYTFRDVSDKELMDYVQMYRFGPMQKFLQAIMAAMQEVLLERSRKVAAELGRK